ncbi:hypothetical protein JCM8547_000595 [Rhodosporidiobolus lusitaniae]
MDHQRSPRGLRGRGRTPRRSAEPPVPRINDLAQGHPRLLEILTSMLAGADAAIDEVLEDEDVEEKHHHILLEARNDLTKGRNALAKYLETNWAQEYFDSVGPIMIEELLRHIANDLNRTHLLNTRKKQTYPRPDQLEDLKNEGRLTPELCALLQQAVMMQDAHQHRNNHAHPNGANGAFRRQAKLLELHTPGWMKACDEFVESHKGLSAATFSSSEDPEIYKQKRLPWDPEQWDEDGYPHNPEDFYQRDRAPSQTWLEVPTPSRSHAGSVSYAPSSSALSGLASVGHARAPSASASTFGDWYNQPRHDDPYVAGQRTPFPDFYATSHDDSLSGLGVPAFHQQALHSPRAIHHLDQSLETLRHHERSDSDVLSGMQLSRTPPWRRDRSASHTSEARQRSASPPDKTERERSGSFRQR